jgi:hypothetical protein
MDQNWIESFREKLDQHYSWPSLYIFKFIVPHGKEDEVKRLFPKHNVTERQSNQGKYISVTVEMMLPSSQAVIDVYVQASAIEGIVAL